MKSTNIILKNFFLIIIILGGITFNSCKEDQLTPQEILNQIELSPNPFKESFNIIIHGQVVGEFEYTIYDRWGSTIVNELFNVNSDNIYSHEVTLNSVDNGVYYIVIEFEGVEINKVVQRNV